MDIVQHILHLKQLSFLQFLYLSFMYPSLDGRDSLKQTTYKKTLPPSEEMTKAILEIREVMPTITSFKPHLNSHECQLNMLINNKINIPLKIVFLRNYPKQRPLIFVTQWIRHPIVNEFSCQIQYQNEFPWNPSVKISQLLKRIQNKFTQNLPTYDSDLQKAIQTLDNYGRQVESLRTKPQGTQPPPLPNINLESTLKTFEYQENLQSQCQQKNSLYQITAQQYNENLSRVKCVSQKFGKGKIIREMQKQIESEISQNQNGRIQDILQGYYQNRKKLHKMKILKELYLEN